MHAYIIMCVCYKMIIFWASKYYYWQEFWLFNIDKKKKNDNSIVSTAVSICKVCKYVYFPNFNDILQVLLKGVYVLPNLPHTLSK